MPVWPFKRRRDSAAPLKDSEAPRPRKRSLTDPPSPPNNNNTAWSPQTQTSIDAAPAPDVPRHSARPGRQPLTSRIHRRDISQPDISPPTTADMENVIEKKQPALVPGKENVPRNTDPHGSREDITALPVSPRLQQSPHLRAVDLDRTPFIPYNFHSQSRTLPSRAESQRTLPASTKRSATLRSRKSEAQTAQVPERTLTQKQKKTLREEEIRAMSAPLPIPKRRGDDPLRRDSKKVRNSLLAKDSNISLPAAESIQSTMNPSAEQRGWEIGILDSFSPRPAVRLSGTPQYVHPGSVTNTPVTASREKQRKEDVLRQEEKIFAEQKQARDKEYLIEKAAEKRNEKRPTSRRKSRKRQTIGAAVDDLDSTDLRILLERDTKRREERQKAKQEKLERKLLRRADSEKKRLPKDELHMTEDERQRHEELRRLRSLISSPVSQPTAIHPALRTAPPQEVEVADTVGLGIEHDGDTTPTRPKKDSDPFLTPQASTEFDRFLQPQPSTEFGSDGYHTPQEGPATVTPPDRALATPLEEDEYSETEDFVVNTAKAVRLSQTMTNPIAPIDSKPQTVTVSQEQGPSRQQQQKAAAPKSETVSRPTSEVQSKRSSGWTTFFRRRTQSKPLDSQKSFANTSRESMRNQPLPAHLVDSQARSQSSFERRSSGTPARTMSKFKEDLPEMPSSPTESTAMSYSSDLTSAAARTARRATLSDAPGEPIAEDDAETPRPLDNTGARSDTPISPRRGKLSTSMASIGSEGSWLASGSVKRKSRPTSLNRATGSLSKRNPAFAASYEELGEDQDAAYVKLSGGVRPTENLQTVSTVGSGGIDSRLDGDSSDPLTVHGSARRRPTISSGPRVQSREGLVSEFANANVDPSATPPIDDTDFFGQDSPAPQVHSATSVNFGRGHVRQISAGSARVLEIPPRDSSDATKQKSPISPNAPSSSNPVRNSGMSAQFQPGFM